MRFPIRHQIMVPMLAIMLTTLAAASVFHGQLAVRRARDRMRRQASDVAQVLARSTFPLSDAVLRQVGELTGTRLLLVDPAGATLASSLDPQQVDAARHATPGIEPSAVARQLIGAQPLLLDAPVRLDGQRHYVLAHRVTRVGPAARDGVLWMYCPATGYVPTWWEMFYPPLLLGLGTLILVAGSAVLIGARVNRPLAGLQAQLDGIARGEFVPRTPPERDDELRDLSLAINRTAETLSRYEEEVRRGERLATLGQLGGGIAHHLRNCATGCRLALDLHREDCAASDGESLRVALSQLNMMETYLRRFLALGQAPQIERRRLDVGQLVLDTLPLVEPFARHVAVELQVSTPIDRCWIEGDGQALQELLVTLLLNAIEAASGPGGQGRGTVQVELAEPAGGQVRLSVMDTGPGPAESIRPRLFDEFVTDKAHGTGLGLASAARIAQAHGGCIELARDAARTEFRVTLSERGTSGGDVADCG